MTFIDTDNNLTPHPRNQESNQPSHLNVTCRELGINKYSVTIKMTLYYSRLSFNFMFN